MNRCRRCGIAILDGDKFCRHCPAQFEEDSAKLEAAVKRAIDNARAYYSAYVGPGWVVDTAPQRKKLAVLRAAKEESITRLLDYIHDIAIEGLR